ncbi:PREDICTED: RUN domain-containing protein 1 [Papilio xuthus]|uniref:RUN domain-containing protein 1 n=1 Tax=Papilio xuthus TaxID=66420 RepID=A0AAJ6ZHV3_PAPXU|nr:PREDICTED: RUN domain-containing protein 1 [Papilio xuthus]
MDEACEYEGEGEIPIWQEPRCEPLGAPKENLCDETTPEQLSGDRIHALEEEQEILSSSVFSLTSHLAQVEFRLRQILKAPPEEKDSMLQALEQFTSRGVPDSRTAPQGSAEEISCNECVELERKMKRQRAKQAQFVERLKSQLKELERFATDPKSESGDSTHRTLIEHLRSEIDRSLEEGCHQPLSADELRHQINCAVRQYADKQLSKEEIIGKLQTHIEDMQKFIKLIKNEDLSANGKTKPEPKKVGKSEAFEKNFARHSVNDELKAETINLMRKASTLIQIFTVSQFGCSPNSHKKYDKRSPNVTHWGNLRARLEMSIDAVLHLVSRERQSSSIIDSYDSDSEEGAVIINDAPLTTAVRRHLAINLRDLLQHGLVGPDSTSLVPIIGCFPVRRSSMSRNIHIWELILRYYELNDGDRFNSTPARKLSQSFNLDIVGGTAITNKQSLLSNVGSIIASHTPYKRSYDAHFKAFVCAALNSHKLVMWLNIMLKSRSLIDSYYSSTSYIVNTGFQDALQSLDRLTPYNFDLPVDLAVKQFQNIKDVFM